jgi:glycosyltransferase involved in cell wall biosynthesis
MRHRVSVIVPARNEAAYIDACVRSIHAQSVDADLEVIVADGCSSDETAARAAAAGAVVVENPERITPAALNRGLAVASGDVIVRFDAHSEMMPGYIRACLRALDDDPKAVNVGGWCEVRGMGPWGRAVAAALQSPLGVGNPRLWRSPREGEGRRYVETVPFGCFRADALRAAGGWRPDLVRNQDFELNHRLRAAEGRIVFDPSISFVYRPRESLAALSRQYREFGRWKAIMLADAPDSVRARQFAPLLLVATALLTLVPGRTGRISRTGAAVYAGVISLEARRARDWRVAPVLAAIHLSWGAGFVVGTTHALRRRIFRT